MRRSDRKSALSGLWETLLHPDREEFAMKERLVVISAANQLQVGEFQLLQLAYRAWHHKDLPEALVTKLFTSYMLHNRVPHWARHYARRVIALEELGDLDDLDPRYHRYDTDYHTHVPRGLRRFCVATAVLRRHGGGDHRRLRQHLRRRPGRRFGNLDAAAVFRGKGPTSGSAGHERGDPENGTLYLAGRRR